MDEIWDDVCDAVNDAISYGEGHVIAFYLAYYFQKAGITVGRADDLPPLHIAARWIESNPITTAEILDEAAGITPRGTYLGKKTAPS